MEKAFKAKRRISFASVLAHTTAVLLLTTAVVCVADVRNAYADDAAASTCVHDYSATNCTVDKDSTVCSECGASVWDGVSVDESFIDPNNLMDSYTIMTAPQLKRMVDVLNMGSYDPTAEEVNTVVGQIDTGSIMFYLGRDIDLNNKPWDRIGIVFENTSNEIACASIGLYLYGEGHTIRRMNVDLTDADSIYGHSAGFIGRATGFFWIQDLTFDECTSKSSVYEDGYGSAGIVFGDVSDSGMVMLCNVKVKNSVVETPMRGGGVIGRGFLDAGSHDVIVENCVIRSNEKGIETGGFGGIIGEITSSTSEFKNCGVIGTSFESNSNSDVAVSKRFGVFVGSCSPAYRTDEFLTYPNGEPIVDDEGNLIYPYIEGAHDVNMTFSNCYSDVRSAMHNVYQSGAITADATNNVILEMIGEEWTDKVAQNYVINVSESYTRWVVESISDGSASNAITAKIGNDKTLSVRDDIIGGTYSINFYSEIKDITDLKVNGSDFSDYVFRGKTFTVNLANVATVASLSFNVEFAHETFAVNVVSGFEFMPEFTISAEGVDLSIVEGGVYYFTGLTESNYILTFNERLAEGATVTATIGGEPYECTDGQTINFGNLIGSYTLELTYSYDGVDFPVTYSIFAGLISAGYPGVYIIPDERWETLEHDGKQYLATTEITDFENQSIYTENSLFFIDIEQIKFKFAATSFYEDDNTSFRITDWDNYYSEIAGQNNISSLDDNIEWQEVALEFNGTNRVNIFNMTFSSDAEVDSIPEEENHYRGRAYLYGFTEDLQQITVETSFNSEYGSVVLKDPTGRSEDIVLSGGTPVQLYEGKTYNLCITPRADAFSSSLLSDKQVKAVLSSISFGDDDIYNVDSVFKYTGTTIPVRFVSGSKIIVNFKEEIPTGQTKVRYTVNGATTELDIVEFGTTKLISVNENSAVFLAPVIGYSGEKCSVYINNQLVATISPDDRNHVDSGYYYYTIPKLENTTYVYFEYSCTDSDVYVSKIVGNYTLQVALDISIDTIKKSGTKAFEFITQASPHYPFVASQKHSTPTEYAFQSSNGGIEDSISYVGIKIPEEGFLMFDYYVDCYKNDYAFVMTEKPTYENTLFSSDTDSRYISGDKSSSSGKNENENKWQTFSRKFSAGIVYIGYRKTSDVSLYNDVLAIKNVGFYSGTANLFFTAPEGRSSIKAYNATTGTELAWGAEVKVGDRIRLVYTNANYRFMGWRNEFTEKIESTSTTYEFTVTTNTVNYSAITSPLSGGEYIAKDEGNFYKSLAEAFKDKTSGTIILIADYELKENVTLPAGVTLLMPYAESDTTGFKIGGNHVRTSWFENEKPYVTLTIASGATLTLNGKLIVGGVQHLADQSAQGHTSGAYSQVVVNGNVEIADGGYLDVVGRVTGNGIINAKAGATLRQPYTVNNYAGGTNTANLYNADQFPFVQFATINVECKQIVNYGAKVIGSTSLYFWSSITTQDVVLVDSFDNKQEDGDGALIWLKGGSRLEISYNANKTVNQLVGGENGQGVHLGDFGVTTIDVYGEILAGEFSLDAGAGRYGSEAMVLAIPYTYNFNIKSGATITLTQKYKIMPGAVVTIDNGATVDIQSTGALYVYDGLIQADKSGKAYPSADILGNYGFAKSGMLIVNGTLDINGAFAGIAQTVEGGVINVANSATVSEQSLAEGSTGGYTNNETKFKMSGRVFGVNGFVNLVAGNTYKTFANDAFTLKTFTVNSAARIDNLSVELNQAMNGRFAQWNGEKFVLTLAFYIGIENANVLVNIGGVDYQTDENGRFTCTVEVASAADLIDYYTTNVYTAVKSHALTFYQDGVQTLTHVASGVALNNDNVYTRVYDKDGELVQDFKLFATVSFYGTTDTESVELSFDSELNGVYVTENVELKDTTGTIGSFTHNLAVVGKNVSQFVEDVKALKDAENIVARATELFETYRNLTVQNKTVDSDFIKDYFDNVVKLDDFAGQIAKDITITGSATYGDGEVAVQITYINGTTATATATLSNVKWDSNQSKVVGTATLNGKYDGKAYTVSKTCDVARKAVTVKIKPQSSVYGDQIVIDNSLVDISGVINGDDLGITLTRGSNSINVGEYVLTGTWTNMLYSVTFENGTYTITPYKATVVITKPHNLMEGKTAVTIFATVQGAPDANYANSLTYELRLGDVLIATVDSDGKISVVDGQTLSRGTYRIIAVNGNDNYVIESQNDVTLEVVEVNNYYEIDFGDSEKVYDGKAFVPTVVVKVRETGEAVTEFEIKVTLGGKESEILNVGNYEIVLTVSADGSEFTHTFAVKERPVTVKIDNKTSVYGDSEVALTAIASGLVEGDTIDTLNITLTKANGLNVGEYAITGEAHNSNYAVTFENGTYTITAKVIVVEIENKESFYGEKDAVLSAKLKGSLAYTDSFDSLGIKLVRAAGKNAGTYAITLDSWTNENYTITAEKAEYTVKKLALRAIVANATSVYGDPLAHLTFTIEGKFAEGESVDVLKAKLSIGNAKNAGTYGIEFAYDNANYDVSATNATYTITKREVTLLVQNATSVYGDSDAALVVSITKGTMAYGEDAQSLVSITRAEGRVVGTYAITATKADNANYDVTLVYTGATNSVYTITKRPVTVTVKNAELAYTASWAELNSALRYESNGLAGDELNVRLFVIVGGVELTADNFGSMFAGGTHVISASIDNGNYELTVVNGALTVGLPVVSLTDAARGITRVYGDTQNVFNWRTMLTGYLASATDSTFRAVFYRASDLTTPVDIATAGAGAYKMQIEIVHTTAYTFADGKSKSEFVDVTVEKKDLTDSIVITLGGLTDGGYLVFSYGLSIDASVTGHGDIEIVKVLTKDGTALDEIDSVGAYEYTATIQDANYKGAKTLRFKVVNSAEGKIEGLKKYAGVEFLTRAQYAEAKALLEGITEDDTLQINDDAEAKANYANVEALCANYAKVAANLDEIKGMLDAYAEGESKKLIEAHDYIVALDEEKLALVKQSEEGKAYQEAWQAARAEGAEATEIANKVRDNVLFGVVAAVSALLAMAYVALGKFRV